MSEGFKLREMVHMGDQVGVPANMKAAGDYKPNIGFKKKDPALRESLILQYIKDHEGKTITTHQLGVAAGYGSTSTANIVVRKLMRRGKIQRLRINDPESRAPISYTYRLANSTTPMVDYHGNGPVFVHTDETLVKAKQEAVVAEAAKHLEEAHYRGLAQKREDDARFIARLNMEAWKYLTGIELNNQGQNPETRLGREALALRGFINSLTNSEGVLDGKGNVGGSQKASGDNQA